MSATKKENMPVLEAIAIIDAALIIAEKITAYLNDKRMIGELTTEEEAALDARQEKMFSSPAWKQSTNPSP